MKSLLVILSLVIIPEALAAKKKASKTQLKNLYRASGEVINEKSYEIEVRGEIFTKSASYDIDGNSVAMDEGTSFSMMDYTATLRYGYSRSLEFRVGGKWRSLTSTNTTDELQNSGFESIFGGAKYSFKNVSRWRYALDVQYRQTGYSNQEFAAGQAPNNEIILGDSGSEVTMMAHASYYLSKHHVFSTTFGYNVPPANLSHEFIYDINMAWPYTRFGMVLGVEGIYSTGSDEFTEDPSQKPSVNTGGVTALFNSVNREVVKPYAKISVAFESFKVDIFANQTVMGKSTDEGLTAGLNIVWGSKGITDKQRRVTKFKEYLVEASVVKLSPRGKFVKIDKGISSDVEKGMKFDIYQSDFFGGNVLVMSGTVYEVGSDWAIIRLEKRFKDISIKKGFTARGY